MRAPDGWLLGLGLTSWRSGAPIHQDGEPAGQGGRQGRSLGLEDIHLRDVSRTSGLERVLVARADVQQRLIDECGQPHSGVVSMELAGFSSPEPGRATTGDRRD